MHDSRDDFDRTLDSALATYADPGLDSGLESRILSRIAAETPAAPRRRWLAWAVALPVAAILLLFAGLSIARQMYAPRPASRQGHVSPQPLARSDQQAAENGGNLYRSTTSKTAKKFPTQKGTGFSPYKDAAELTRALAPEGTPHSRRAALVPQAEPLPKLDIFPTPQPLTQEERALVDFAAHTTKSERESLVIAQQQADAPLHIAAIQIKPLQPPASGAN